MPITITIKKKTLLVIILITLFFFLGLVFGLFLFKNKKINTSTQLPKVSQSTPKSISKPSFTPRPKPSPTPKPTPISIPSWLIGIWWLYLDCPSPKLEFYDNGKVRLEQCDEAGYIVMDKLSTYIYDGQDTIIVKSTESGGDDMVLYVTQKSGRRVLEIKGDGRSFHKASN